MRRVLLLLAAMSASLFTEPAFAQRIELKTRLITQQTDVWCWAATAGMALELLGFADIDPGRNYQCGVVAAAFPECRNDCTQCDSWLPLMTGFLPLLVRYDLVAGQGEPHMVLSPVYSSDPQWGRITRSLDLSYPVIAGISPDEMPDDPAAAEHSVLITGYDDDYRGTGQQWVVVKDPYPYDDGDNPYASVGYAYDAATGKAQLPWSVLRDRLNLTSAVFLNA